MRAFNWRRSIIDIGIVLALYVLVEFTRTQEQPVTDWATWGRGLSMGVLYRAAPELLTVLGALRAKVGSPGASPGG